MDTRGLSVTLIAPSESLETPPDEIRLGAAAADGLPGVSTTIGATDDPAEC